MINDLSAAHIAAQLGAFEPQRGNNGLLRIFGLVGDQKGPKGESILTLSLNGFALPAVTVEALEIMWLNERRKVAGGVTFEDIEITYKDYVDVPTAHILKTWHEEVYNPVNGKIGLASIYKKTGIMELFAPNGTHSRFWTVVGIWPNSFNPGAIDMTAAEPILITTTLSIDKAYAADKPTVAKLIASKAISIATGVAGI